MNAREVLEALLQGKKMRREFWGDEHYIFIDQNNELMGNCFDCYSQLKWLNSGDWGIYRDTEKLNLGPEHVGRRVRMENGNIDELSEERYQELIMLDIEAEIKAAMYYIEELRKAKERLLSGEYLS